MHQFTIAYHNKQGVRPYHNVADSSQNYNMNNKFSSSWRGCGYGKYRFGNRP